MEHALHLLILLVLTRLGGELFERIRQPASMGEIAAGIALLLLAALPFAPPLLVELPDSPFLEIAAEFGIFAVLLFAGVEMRPREIVAQSAAALAVALGGVIVPLAGGLALAWVFLPETPLKLAQALLVGVALSISAIPVAVKVLMELQLLHRRVGETIVSAAVLDDVIGLVLLAIVLSVIRTGSVPDANMILVLLGKVGLFFAVAVAAGMYLEPAFYRSVARLRIPAPLFSGLLIVAVSYALLAEALGMDFVLGPFIAGLFFDPDAVGEEGYASVRAGLEDVTNGLLGPLFFASIGVRLDVGAVMAVPVFLVLLLAVAFLGKLIGAGLPARLAGLSTREAAAVGIGMSGRGAVELVVASIALEAGLFGQADILVSNLFSALVITAVVTTMVMPVALRAVLRPSDGGRRSPP
jgi:Kef-type K+ transport system membrane component KefB